MAAAPQLTLEQVKGALNAALIAIEVPENKQKLQDAKTEAAGNLMVLMQKVMPVLLEVLGPHLESMGLPVGQPGVQALLMQSAQFQSDPEIAAGKAKLMAVMMGQ